MMRGKIKRALAGLFVLLLALCLSAGLYVCLLYTSDAADE